MAREPTPTVKDRKTSDSVSRMIERIRVWVSRKIEED